MKQYIVLILAVLAGLAAALLTHTYLAAEDSEHNRITAAGLQEH